MNGIIFLVLMIGFGIIRAIIRNAQEGQRLQQQQQAAAPQHRERVQSEIDAFLKDVGAPARGPEAVPPAQQDRPQRPQRRPRPQRTPQPEPKPQRTMQSRAAERRAEEQVTQRAARQRIANRTIAHEVGSGIDRHVETYMAKQVDRHVQADIVASVESHLGSRRGEMPEEIHAAVAVSPSARLREMLRSGEGVRNAMLLNEILSRPRALRK